MTQILIKNVKIVNEMKFFEFDVLIKDKTIHKIENIKSIDTSLICGIKVFMAASTGNMLVDNEQTLESIFQHAKTLATTHCEYSPIIDINKIEAK